MFSILGQHDGPWGLVAGGASFSVSTFSAAAVVALLSAAVSVAVSASSVFALSVSPCKDSPANSRAFVIVGQCGKLVRIFHEGLQITT